MIVRCLYLVLLAPLVALAGCRQTAPQAARALIAQRSSLNLAGLQSIESLDSLEVSLAVPAHWVAEQRKGGLFYTHQQWRSPSRADVVGVVYLTLPFPLSAPTLLRLAEKQFADKTKDVEVLESWVDRYGRYWFEGQNEKYHGRGYIVVEGLKAWVAYTGYERKMPYNQAEFLLGKRSLDTILPAGLTIAASRGE